MGDVKRRIPLKFERRYKVGRKQVDKIIVTTQFVHNFGESVAISPPMLCKREQGRQRKRADLDIF